MAIGPAGYVSIAELIVYIPALGLALLVCSRHGWHRASGWVYTTILCVVRIAGAICQLVTYTDSSKGLLEATLIIDSIGLSPLLFATLGMLSRFVDWINARGGSPLLGMVHFRIVQLLIALGLILSIVGGTSISIASDGTVQPAATSKAGSILYILAFAGLTLILIITAGYRTSVPIQERRIPIAVAVAWPFIASRLLYSVISVFAHNKTFSVIGGDVGVHVAMAVVEEFVVAIVYLVLGFSLKKLKPEQQGDLANRRWKNRRNANSGAGVAANAKGRRGRAPKGPVHALIDMARKG